MVKKSKLYIPVKKAGYVRLAMKKSPLKRKSKSEIRKIQDKLWQECRRIVKARYIRNAKYYCFTCSKEIEGAGCQLGHFIPNASGGALLRYNLDNLRLQCYYCNINLGGNGAEFYRRMVLENGQDFVDKLFSLKGQTVKAHDHYLYLFEEYQKL